MEKRELEVGDVVQINPEMENCFFKGCFMMVTEPKPWGAQGFICMPENLDSLPDRAYFRCKFEHMEYVGKAVWVPQDEVVRDELAKGDDAR